MDLTCRWTPTPASRAAVARGVAERLADADHDSGWMVAPPIGYGASGEHESFSGTVSIGTSALRLLLVEFGRSAASWARRLVFVNGHGGNVEALAAAAALLRYEGRDVGLVLLRRRERRRPRRPHRNVCIATYFAG